MSERTPLFHAAVFVILKNERGEILLQQRANTGFMDGRYDGSATGHVEPNESIHDAALRELEEELGVSAKADDLKLVLIAQMDVDKPYLNFAFICERWEGEPRIAEPEKNAVLDGIGDFWKMQRGNVIF